MRGSVNPPPVRYSALIGNQPPALTASPFKSGVPAHGLRRAAQHSCQEEGERCRGGKCAGVVLEMRSNDRGQHDCEDRKSNQDVPHPDPGLPHEASSMGACLTGSDERPHHRGHVARRATFATIYEDSGQAVPVGRVLPLLQLESDPLCFGDESHVGHPARVPARQEDGRARGHPFAEPRLRDAARQDWRDGACRAAAASVVSSPCADIRAMSSSSFDIIPKTRRSWLFARPFPRAGFARSCGDGLLTVGT